MDSRRPRNFRNNFDRTIFDKQVDKFFETGRQFVDGVSGARPGKKRNNDFQGISRRNVKKVGRWVTDKMDMFFDEEDVDWNDEENRFEGSREIKSFTRESSPAEVRKIGSKRPLEALSLRQTKNLQTNELKKLPYADPNSFDEWPNDSDLKVDRWQRSSETNNPLALNEEKRRGGLVNGRSLPKSRRRRI